mgnify:CR=1 FL=1
MWWVLVRSPGWQVTRDTFFDPGYFAQALPLVYVDDVVDALLCAAEAPLPAQRVFNVVDTSRVTQQDYLARCRRKLGDEIKVVRVPRWVFMLLGFGVVMALKARRVIHR